MITPVRILNKYRAVEPYLDPVRVRARTTLLAFCEREGHALVSRIKTIDSVAEKVETGRFASWGAIDDLVAFTVVVPRVSDEASVLAFLREAFDELSVRARGTSKKSPDVFRFDSTRFIGRLAWIGQDLRPPLFEVPFEVQIRSAFEHAWSVTTHALTYKSPDVSWSKLRLTAQMKSAVEQLDTLVAAFEDASRYVEQSSWPEIQAKADLKSFFQSKFAAGEVPIELAPKDWSRFVDNVFGAVRGAHDRSGADNIGHSICVAIEEELKSLGKDTIPLSISLWQLTFASIVKSGSLRLNTREYWPLITPELEALYPLLRSISPRFDYS